MLSPDQGADLPGATVFDPEDEQLGTVEAVFVDGDDHPRWAAVALEDRRAIVPLDGAELDGDELRVRFPRELVIDAPEIESDALAPEDEAALAAHYGIARRTP